MNKKVAAAACCLALMFSISACKKKEPEKPVTQPPIQPAPQGPIMQPAPQMPQQRAPQMPLPRQNMMRPMGETKIVVPETVKGKWSAVKIVVEDKTTKKIQEYTVKLNSNFTIPDSSLKVFVGEFLPDFKMNGLVLTSKSNEPSNPAVGIRVLEGNKQIFPVHNKKWGWLWAHKELQAVHPFNHPRYNFTLKEGIPTKG